MPAPVCPGARQPRTARRRRGSPALLALAALAIWACIDDVSPFRADDRGERSPPIRLTTSLGEDRGPAWSRDGRFIYYRAQRYEEMPQTDGVLLRIPVTGGTADPLLPTLQAPDVRAQHLLFAPSAAPGDSSVAFVEIVQAWPPHPCPLQDFSFSCSPGLSEVAARLPPLRTLAVRVRQLASSAPLENDAGLKLEVEGATVSLVVHNYPFQRLFALERSFALRPAWAPEGDRLVVSDGLGLYLWTPASGQVEQVPGTDDAAWPAWSPDGEWIAYTRLQRGDSIGAVCTYRDNIGAVSCVVERTDYLPGPHTLTLIHPDGSGRRGLGEGDEPAWSPDGATLYFRRGDRIWHSAADGGGAEPVPDTEHAREPAVSPDGRFLAVARLDENGDHNIWIIPLAR